MDRETLNHEHSTPAARIRRGFHRIALFFAVPLWLIAAGWLAVDMVPLAYSQLHSSEAPFTLSEMDRIKRNVVKMVNKGATHEEVLEYARGEGVTQEQIREHKIADKRDRWAEFAASADNRSRLHQDASTILGFAVTGLVLLIFFKAIGWVAAGFF